jgi:hypothetical protein
VPLRAFAGHRRGDEQHHKNRANDLKRHHVTSLSGNPSQPITLVALNGL